MPDARPELDLRIEDAEHDPKPLAMVPITVLVALAVAVLGAWLMGWLAVEVRHGDTLAFDAAVRNWVHLRVTPTLTKTAWTMSFLGDKFLVASFLVTQVIFLIVHWRRAAAWLAVAMGGALILDLALKFAFHRMRPSPFFGTPPHTYSFPSGHALFALCFYGVLAGLWTDRVDSRALQSAIWTAAAALILAIGMSRIYLGVHYASDVVGGYLTAAAWVAGIIVLDHLRIRRKRNPNSGPA